MSWLASIGQRAREAAGAVGNVGVTARAALNSVTSFADDRARRIGQALHARVTGRGHSIDDAVVRVERAVVECVPAQRPAMLRPKATPAVGCGAPIGALSVIII